jgi:outer membrane protein with beta-barrel domain
MLNRNALLLVAGAAFFALDASAASAQDSTTSKPRAKSERRIPVSKESHGEVVAPRVDTVTVFRTDTLRMAPRVDTVTVTNTVTRIDTVVQTVPVITHPVSGFYFGLAGGTNMPSGGLNTVNTAGGTAQMQVGYRKLQQYWGVQLDGQYSQFGRANGLAFLGGRPDVWNINLDGRVDVPWVNRLFGNNTWFSPYVIGGASWVDYTNLRQKLDEFNDNSSGIEINPVISDGGSHWGWNAGGGLAWHMGRHEVFIESRLIQFNRGTSSVNGVDFETARQIPIVFGVNFF